MFLKYLTTAIDIILAMCYNLITKSLSEMEITNEKQTDDDITCGDHEHIDADDTRAGGYGGRSHHYDGT